MYSQTAENLPSIKKKSVMKFCTCAEVVNESTNSLLIKLVAFPLPSPSPSSDLKVPINKRNYRVQNCASYWHHVLYVSEGSDHVTAT